MVDFFSKYERNGITIDQDGQDAKVPQALAMTCTDLIETQTVAFSTKVRSKNIQYIQSVSMIVNPMTIYNIDACQIWCLSKLSYTRGENRGPL